MTRITPIQFGVLLLIFGVFPITSLGAGESSRKACEPFAVHRNAHPLALWKKSTGSRLQSPELEREIIDEISRINTYGSFGAAYRKWARSTKGKLTAEERIGWLQCVRFHAKQDTDQDGIPDWRALIDAKPSQVLFPQDEDIDGDGTTNVLDPQPFFAGVSGKPAPSEVPAHLRAARKETAELQKRLFEDFGIIAIEHTGEHSPLVLKNLHFLLKHGFGSEKSERLGTFRYIYAFAGHDTKHDMAAYHVDAKAISIGDRDAYPDASFGDISIPILSTLAHEIGHAFLFEKLSPDELKKVSAEFGGWGPVYGKEPLSSFFAPEFFFRHPMRRKLRKPSSEWNPADFNVASSYSLSNVHEWFADAFAASTLVKLGRANLLRAGWEKELHVPSKRFRTDWTNYNNVSNDFISWVGKKLRN